MSPSHNKLYIYTSNLRITAPNFINRPLYFLTLLIDHIISSFISTEETTISFLEIKQVAESDVGDYQCIASLLSELWVFKSNYASLDLLGFVGGVSDVVVKREDAAVIAVSVRSEEGVLLTCTLSEGIVDMWVVREEGNVVEYEGAVSGILDQTLEVDYRCQVTYSKETIYSQTAAISIIGTIAI